MSVSDFFHISIEQLAGNFLIKFSEGLVENQLITFVALENAWELASENICANKSISETIIENPTSFARPLFDEIAHKLLLISDRLNSAILQGETTKIHSFVQIKMALSFLYVLSGTVIGREWELVGDQFVVESAELVAEFEVTYPALNEKQKP